MDKAPTRHRVRVTEANAGTRLDKFLAGALDGLSRERIKRLIRSGQVTVTIKGGGESVADAPARATCAGEVITVRVPEAVDAAPEPQAMALDILHEDDYLIVIDKPAGLVVHPAPGNPDHTLVNALIDHCGASLSGIGGVKRPGIVHRLDKDTSGVMVAAKTDAAHAGLAEQFAAHTVERVYNCLTRGALVPGAGEFSGSIGRSPRNRKKMAVVERGGKIALTRYRVRARYGAFASFVECRLATGRTHQIRVHLAHALHPILGDPVYGGARALKIKHFPAAAREALKALNRQALHARSLGFEHPISGAALKFESDFPPDMKQLIAELERSAK